MQERKNGDKDLYILYDYNEVATNFENYLAEQRAGDGIQEEEVYEFIYTCLDTSYLSCMNHMEYLTMNPYNIYVSRSQYQKFILGKTDEEIVREINKRGMVGWELASFYWCLSFNFVLVYVIELVKR